MDSILGCLAGWMPRQRWYAGKGRPPALRLVADVELPSGTGDARVRTLLVADEATLPTVLYQVPIVARPTASVEDAEYVIGSPRPGITLIDGPHDAAYTDVLLRLVNGGGTAGDVIGHRVSGATLDAAATSAEVLGVEQSNTSIVFRSGPASPPVICKIYRRISPGTHPDVEIQSALSSAGSPYIAPVVGWLEGRWDGDVTGALAFAQEFVVGGRDGWKLALTAAANGEDFTDAAADLARATASVHTSLADVFGTEPAPDAAKPALTSAWQRRLATAIAEVPALAPLRTAIETVYRTAADTTWPDLQRIHGDLHLGQTLSVLERGWIILDFEGEPLRPMSERTLPDLALRDVAGMLRSFDYVAGSIGIDHPGRPADAVAEWAAQARAAYLDAYAESAGIDIVAVRPLLDALELDKAVYEVIYEARSRPTWISIPQRAIARLARGEAATG